MFASLITIFSSSNKIMIGTASILLILFMCSPSRFLSSTVQAGRRAHCPSEAWYRMAESIPATLASSIRFFEISTQISIKTLQKVDILPANDIIFLHKTFLLKLRTCQTYATL